MIGHHRQGAQINCKQRGQLEDPCPDLVSSIAKIPPGLDINATKKLTPHAPGDDAVMRCGVQQDQLVARHRHSGSAQFGLENQPSGRATDGL